MTQQRKARYLTIAVVAVVAILAAGQQLHWRLPAGALSIRRAQRSQPPEPSDAIYEMLDAARSGDAAAYLGCFTGQMAAALRQSQAEMGTAAFAQYLINSNQEIKGAAVSDPVPLTDREARVRVEYIYPDRNEVQQVGLERDSGGVWRIARVDSTERAKTLIPYGTPVK
jgi:hypothetical protein